MSNADIRGRFIWHELMTTDTDAAKDFYSSIVPWKTQDSGMPSYTLWMSGKTQAGGLMALPDGDASGTPPHWIIYIGTPDVDATVEAAQKLGGKVLKSAADIPNVGRFAVLSDPQGAAFAAYTPAPGSSDGGAAGGGAIGDFTWHELATTDPDSAWQFYSELFGWSKGAAHDMGAMGIYQLVSHGGMDIGGFYKARDTSVPPSWLSYVRVADAAKVSAAVKDAGGRVVNGPMEVPGGSWVVMLLDPQGGAFAVVEAPKAAAAKRPRPAKPASRAVPASKAAAKPVTPKATPAKAAPKKAPASKVPAKKAPKKKAAARKAAGKSARKSAVAKKRPAAKKGTSVKRGVAVKKASKSGKRAATKSAKGKAKSKK